MRMGRVVLVVALAAASLAACKPRPPAPAATAASAAAAPVSFIPSAQTRQQFLAEGPEPTLRRLSQVDYVLHYQLMQATGIEKSLGGEAKAIAALQALGNAYEKSVRAAGDRVPRMMPAAFTGEGMASGFMGMGVGSFTGLVTGGMMAAGVSSMSAKELADLAKAGPLKNQGTGGEMELQIGKDGAVSQALDMEVNEGGLNGRVKVRTHMDGCPDPSGRITVNIDVDSQMSIQGKPGSGGYLKSEFRYERYIDDDAHLIDTADGGASDMHLRMGGFENFSSQTAEVSLGHQRGGEQYFRQEAADGFSIFRTEEIANTQKLIQSAELLQTLMAEMLLRGMNKAPPWEGGHCVDLQVSSTPAKRTAVAPGTSFELEAKPRVKSDGTSPGGSVTATLSGGSALDPGAGKIKPDAKYRYIAPDSKGESASIALEARSKRGVGRATLAFDTKAATAYHMKGGAAGIEFSGQVCSIETTFFLTSSGVTLRFEPESAQGGRYSYSGSMSGFRVHGTGTYVVGYSGDTAVSITAHGPGTVETSIGPQTAEGTENYTLEHISNCDEALP